MSIVCQQVFLTFFDIFQNNPSKSLIYWVCGHNIFLHFYHKKPVFYSFLYNNTHFLLYFFLYFFQIILKHIQFCYFHPHPLFISLQNFSITHTLSYAEQAFLYLYLYKTPPSYIHCHMLSIPSYICIYIKPTSTFSLITFVN